MTNISIESTSVHVYINNLQVIINRMSSNSSSIKTWCITLVSAIIAFAVDKNKPDSMLSALIPIFLFLILDLYYLGLERKYRALYNEFVNKLQSNTVVIKDLFNLNLPSGLQEFLSSLFSISIWPFYILIIFLVFILRTWIF